MLLELCDRILVLCAGKNNGIVDARTATKEQVGLLMTNLTRENQTEVSDLSLIHISLAGTPDLSAELLDSALATFAVNPPRPYQILAITFTNKAAGEIKERLEKTLGEQALDVWAGTFHSVCAKLLRMYIDRLGFERSFTIYDTDDQKRLMTSIIKEFEVSDKTFPPKTVLNEISRAKEKLLLPDDYEATISTHDLRRRTILRLYKEYEKRKHAANALDFDDLILLTVKLFEEDEELLARYRDKFRYIDVYKRQV